MSVIFCIFVFIVANILLLNEKNAENRSLFYAVLKSRNYNSMRYVFVYVQVTTPSSLVTWRGSGDPIGCRRRFVSGAGSQLLCSWVRCFCAAEATLRDGTAAELMWCHSYAIIIAFSTRNKNWSHGPAQSTILVSLRLWQLYRDPSAAH